jgi:iron complex transport system ATP-binding protein
MTDVISLKDVSFRYDATKNILENISFSLSEHQIVGLLGPNGSGKTTLLELITGNLKPESGTIELSGVNPNELSIRRKAQYISYIMQNQVEKPSYYQVGSFVLDGRRPYVKFGAFSAQDYTIAEKSMAMMDISKFSKKGIREISGGEYQRCLLARAITQSTRMIVCDEPCSAMDIKYQIDFFERIAYISDKNKTSFLISIHDINLALKYCNRIIVLGNNQIKFDGKPESMCTEVLTEVYQIAVSKEKPEKWKNCVYY